MDLALGGAVEADFHGTLLGHVLADVNVGQGRTIDRHSNGSSHWILKAKIICCKHLENSRNINYEHELYLT